MIDGDVAARFHDGVAELADEGLTGAGVVVAQLDAGVNRRVPHLAGRIADGVETSRDGTSLSALVRPDGTDHGTYTAGLIVGCRSGRLREGVAPGAELHVVTVIESGNTVARITAGLDWAVAAGARVVCLAAGVAPPARALSLMARWLAEHGIVLVCPIGNGGAGNYVMPGGGAGVLSVGAADGERIATFSGSRNGADGLCSAPLVVAPGVDVVGATSTRGATVESGTSASAALLAGVVALMMEAVPSASPDGVLRALASSSSSPPAGQEHRCVAGFVDPVGAVLSLRRCSSEPSRQVGSLASRGEIDQRLLQLAERVGASAPLPAVIAGRDRAGIAEAIGAVSVHSATLLAHLPVAIVCAPVDALAELSLDHRVLAVDAAHVDRSGRRSVPRNVRSD